MKNDILETTAHSYIHPLSISGRPKYQFEMEEAINSHRMHAVIG